MQDTVPGLDLGLAGVPILVTGAGRGIGRAVALEVARHGARVIVLDRDADPAAEVVGEIVAAGGDALAVTCDVALESDVDAALDTAEAWAGPVLGACLNAGIGALGNVTDTSLDDWRRVLGVNLDGPFLIMRRLLQGMQAEGRGSIVTIGSVGIVKNGHPTSGPAYGVSKAALTQLTRHAAVRYAPHGIRVNSVCPGVVDTGFSARRVGAPADATPLGATIASPMGRSASPAEIAAPVSFLLSSQASFVTGQSLFVDGGLSLI